MNEKIRIGNDIDIRWTLKDGDEQPYILEGRDIAIEVVINDKKRVRIKELEVEANVVHFVFYGKDQKYTGVCDLKFIENDGEKEMVTFDTQAAFTLVPHSWLAIDEGETPETIQLEFVTITSSLTERVGPPGPVGPAAKVGEVTAEVDNETGTPSVDVTTSGPDEQKNIHFAFHNIKGQQGERGPQGGIVWPTLYVDMDMWLHVVEPEHQLSDRLSYEDGYLIINN